MTHDDEDAQCQSKLSLALPNLFQINQRLQIQSQCNAHLFNALNHQPTVSRCRYSSPLLQYRNNRRMAHLVGWTKAYYWNTTLWNSSTTFKINLTTDTRTDLRAVNYIILIPTESAHTCPWIVRQKCIPVKSTSIAEFIATTLELLPIIRGSLVLAALTRVLNTTCY